MQRRYIWLLVAVAAVCVAWTGVWFYAASFANTAIDRALVREAALGRTWTCSKREIAGYPFRFAIRCKELRLSGTTPRGAVSANLGPVRAMVQIYNPKLIIAEADGPVAARLPGRIGAVEAEFSRLRLSIRTGQPIPQRVSLRIEDLKGAVEDTEGVRQDFKLRSGEFHLRPAPDVVADIGAIDLALSVEALSSSLVDNLSRSAEPADANMALRITRAPALVAGRRRPDLESWRQAGGTVTVQKSVVSKGPLQLEASGKLEIDDMRRLAGSLNTRVAGAGRLMQNFGLAGGRTAMSGLLGGLLGGKGEGEPAAKKKLFLPLPLTLRDGYVWVGPIRTKGQLRPLY